MAARPRRIADALGRPAAKAPPIVAVPPPPDDPGTQPEDDQDITARFRAQR